MTGIWSLSDSRWRPEEPVSFKQEKELHDLVEQAPELLPLAGAPRLVMLGREVLCGRGSADLIAVEVATGRPVIIEIKLASNTDRRSVDAGTRPGQRRRGLGDRGGWQDRGMDLPDFLDHVSRGAPIRAGSEQHMFMHWTAQASLRTVAELNTG